MKLIYVGDKTLVYGYSFSQSSSLRNGSQNVAQNEEKKVTQQMMTMFIVFSDSQGFMNYYLGSRGQTVNQGFSLSILQCIREAV